MFLHQKRKNNFLCIDPGISGSGFAAFLEEHIFPVYVRNIYPLCDLKADYKIKANSVVSQLKDEIKRVQRLTKSGFNIVYIERPQSFHDTHRGMTAIRSDSLVKLSYFFGRISELFTEQGFKVNDVAIPKWKGSMKKAQVSSRVKNITGTEYKDHIIDSVGIGLWVKGKF